MQNIPQAADSFEQFTRVRAAVTRNLRDFPLSGVVAWALISQELGEEIEVRFDVHRGIYRPA